MLQSVSQIDFVPQALFPTPNGKGLVYSYPKQKKPFTLQVDEARARNWMRQDRQKKSLLKIDGWNTKSEEYVALFADFDYCPHWFTNHRCFRKYLSKIFGNRGIVLRTPSGNTKVLFLGRIPEDTIMSKGAAVDTLNKIVPEELFNYLDLKVSALSVCYINQDMFETIEQKLPFIEPISVVIDQLEIKTCTSEYPESYFEDLDFESKSIRDTESLFTCGQMHTYRIRKGGINKWFDDVHKPRMVQLIKFFLATPGLIKNFDISQIILGNTLKVHAREAGRLLEKAQDLGLIVVTDPSSVPGEKAKTYRATGLLMRVLKEIYGFGEKSKRFLPKAIENGKWNTTLLVNGLAHFKYQPEKLLDWVVTIAGHDLKDRMKQAFRIVAWLKREFSATAGNDLVH